MSFKPALVVVEMQIDYCDPVKGKLAVDGGALDLAPAINKLLAMKQFVIRIATMNSHHKAMPHDHNPVKKSVVKMSNTKSGSEHETTEQRLWPAHCQPGSEGWQMIHEIHQNLIDLIVKKDMHPDVIMYSGFEDTHGNMKDEMAEGATSHHLEEELKAKGVTDVFCARTAGDFCIAYTAIHAAQAGFKTYVLSDVVRNIYPSGEEFEHQVKEMKKAGVVVTTFKSYSPDNQKITHLDVKLFILHIARKYSTVSRLSRKSFSGFWRN